MDDLKKDRAWSKRYITKHRREPELSFQAFNIWMEHPDWNFKRLSDETGIDYDKILQYSSKYRYQDRRAAKTAYEAEQIHQIQLESKIINARQTSLRQILDENILNAYANFNKTLTKQLNAEDLNSDVLKTLEAIDQHFIKYFQMSNQQLRNMSNLEEIKETIPITKANENEFNKLSEVIKKSLENTGMDAVVEGGKDDE